MEMQCILRNELRIDVYLRREDGEKEGGGREGGRRVGEVHCTEMK